ncbi:MAG: hypothetical protein JW741_26695 [Sedimentisphaerales bacterium]|nr:hypothetical protein [Sedimentisphaerales bacterium]
MRRQKAIAVLVAATMAMSLAGCGKKEDPSETQGPPAPEATPQATPAQPAEKPAPTPTAAPVVEDTNAATETAPPSPRFLGEVLVSWNMGKRDEAVEKFLAIQWDAPTAFQGIPMLVMSEQQLTSLSPEQQERIVQGTQNLSDVLRIIVAHMIATGETKAAAGDTDSAKAHFAAVQRCGEALAKPGRMQDVQAMGQAIAQLAREKLAATQ